jgi:hypothetical protein
MPVLKELTKECYQDLDEGTAQEIRSSLLKPELNPILEDPRYFQPSLPAQMPALTLLKKGPIDRMTSPNSHHHGNILAAPSWNLINNSP